MVKKGISKILVANRGEIAVRIMKTAAKMNIPVVGIYAKAEHDSLHVRLANEAFEMEGASLGETYLNIPGIIEIARKSGADAIHPGYGFLSENENFAGACEKEGIIFIGPRSETIALMGNKTAARDAAEKAGLPVIKGYTGTPGEIAEQVPESDYPVLVKAAAGGGGKGMRIVGSPSDLTGALEATAREAASSFGTDSVFLEKYLENPRHIEIQVLADTHGNVIHLHERECSIQRRYQKIIEEAPSPSSDMALRREMGNAAVRLAGDIGYVNAGTVEFLVDQSGNYYFLEMNTRIQVEHPVTEMVTGTDIVEQQINIAMGRPIGLSSDPPPVSGHAIECRIYAEDPANGFLPSPGKISLYREPSGEGIRVDPAFDKEGEVSGSYDPMICKLVTHGDNRKEARMKMISALENFGIHGIRNNISFLLGLLHHPAFIAADFSTSWCENNVDNIIAAGIEAKNGYQWHIPALAALLVSLRRKSGRNRVWDSLGYHRLTGPLKFCFEGELIESRIITAIDGQFKISLNGIIHQGSYSTEGGVLSITQGTDNYRVFVSENDEGQYMVSFRGFEYFFRRLDFLKRKDSFAAAGADRLTGGGTVYSPMPGRVIRVNGLAGEKVKKGDTVAIVESMKMENNIKAPVSGLIESITVTEGELIDGTTPIMTIESSNQN